MVEATVSAIADWKLRMGVMPFPPCQSEGGHLCCCHRAVPLTEAQVVSRGMLGVDVLAYTYALLYTFHPLSPLPGALAKVKGLWAMVLLVAPRWPHQSWWAELGEAEGIPLASPSWIMLSRVRRRQQHLNPRSFRLRVWPLDRGHPAFLA